MQPRFVMLISLFLFLSCAATEQPKPEPVYAISKEAYDTIQHFDSLGIEESDIDPNYLGFESESLEECMPRAKAKFVRRDELSIAYTACFIRHPIQYEVIL